MAETLVLALVAAGLWAAQAVLHALLARGGAPGGRGLWRGSLAAVVVTVGVPLAVVGGAMLRLGELAGAAILAGAALLTAAQFLLLFGLRPGSEPQAPATWQKVRTVYVAFWLGQTALFWLGLLLTPFAVKGAEGSGLFWNNAAFFAATLPAVPLLVAAGTLYLRRTTRPA